MHFKSWLIILMAAIAVQAIPVQQAPTIEARKPQDLLSSVFGLLFPNGVPVFNDPFGENGAGNGNGNPIAEGEGSQNNNGNPNDNGAGNGNGNPSNSGDSSQNNNGNPTDSGNGNLIGINNNTVDIGLFKE